MQWWLVWFDDGLGLIVVFVPLGLVSSLSRSTTARYKINASSKLGHDLVGVR